VIFIMVICTSNVKRLSSQCGTHSPLPEWTAIDWLVKGAPRDWLVLAADATGSEQQAELLRRHAVDVAERTTGLLGSSYCYDGDAYEDRDEAHIWSDLREMEQSLARLLGEPVSIFGACPAALRVIGYAMLALKQAQRMSASPVLREALLIERGCLAALGCDIGGVRA
jgi:hypothetical protein